MSLLLLFSASGISFDATSNSTYQAASGSYNWSHTVGTGNNQILVVSVGLLSVANSVTGITYNSVALTKLRADVSVSGTVRTEIWYLVAPAAGAHSVAVTLNTASVSGSVASSYNNVDQTSPVDAQNGGTAVTGAGGGSASVSTTTVTNAAWLVDAVASPDTAITVGSGQNSRGNITGAVGSAAQSDKGPISPAAPTTMQWDNVAALTTWTMSTMALKPYTSVVVVSVKNFALLGVG